MTVGCLQESRPAAGLCGNWVRDEGEACEDGNALDGDYCNRSCTRVTGRCGDGVLQTNEACEQDDEDCDSTCTGRLSFCGDGIIQSTWGEQCDPGKENALGCIDCVVVPGSRCEGQPSVCGPEAIDWSLVVASFDRSHYEAYCGWNIPALFGDGALSLPELFAYQCRGFSFNASTVGPCADSIAVVFGSCAATLGELLQCYAFSTPCELAEAGETNTRVVECERAACQHSCVEDTWSCEGNVATLCDTWGASTETRVDCGEGTCIPGGSSETAIDLVCEVDECASDTFPCDPHATCSNTPGSFLCECTEGYTGDGLHCLPLATLIDLHVRPSPVAPALAFDATVLEYDLEVGFATTSLDIEPQTAPGITAQVTAIGSTGNAIVTVPLPIGTTTVRITVGGAEYATQTYILRVARGVTRLIKPTENYYASTYSAQFGRHIALSGDVLVVGAPSANVVDAYSFGSPLEAAGIAWVFVRENGQWSERARAQMSSPRQYTYLGTRVDTDGDGVAIAMPGDGRVLFQYASVSGHWTGGNFLRAASGELSDGFGADVSVQDGTVVVGATGEDSNARGVGGDETNNLLQGSGAVYVFEVVDYQTTQTAYIKASNPDANDRFGSRVALSGDTLAVGVPEEDSSATGVGGNEQDNSSPASGAVYIFVRDVEGTWSQQAYVKAGAVDADDRFGSSLALQGDTLVVGAPGQDGSADTPDDNTVLNSGAAYVFVREAGTWSLAEVLKAPLPTAEDGFGTSVALDDNGLIIGAPGDDSGGYGVNGVDGPRNFSAREDSGVAYYFTRSGGAWSLAAFLKANNTDDGDAFGTSVAIAGDVLAVGAPFQVGGDIGVGTYPFGFESNTEGGCYLYRQ